MALNGIDRLPYVLVGTFMVLGVVVAISAWFLLLAVIAGLIFLALWFTARKQHEESRTYLKFEVDFALPEETWSRAQKMELLQTTTYSELRLVELEKYAKNWIGVADLTQAQPGEKLSLTGYLLAVDQPLGGRLVLLVYDQKVLGEVRRLEIDEVFDKVWARGGIMHLPCTLSFNANREAAGLACNFPEWVDAQGKPTSSERAAWDALWRGARGKTV